MPKKFHKYLYLLLLALCWSPVYLLIKICLTSFPPLTLTSLRVSIAACTLIVVCLLKGYNLLAYRHLWKKFLILGIPCNALPFALVNVGETYISSGLTAIILGAIPIFTALIAHFSISSSEPINLRTAMSALLGFLGVATIYVPSLVEGLVGNELGILLVLLASFFYASAAVFARKHFQGIPALIVPTCQFTISSMVLIPTALLIDHPFSLPFPPVEAILSLCMLAFVGTALAFWIFYRSIQVNGATFTSLNSLLIPVAAVLLGVVILQEAITFYLLLGGLMILSALALTQPYFAKRKTSEVVKESTLKKEEV